MAKTSKFILLLGIFVIIIYLFVAYDTKLGEEVILSRFSLSEKTGFDLAPGELSFGKIEINQSATRGVLLQNNYNEPVIISIESYGDISKNLIVSENNFELSSGESKNITFSVYTKGLTEFKEYSGKVIIIYREA